MHNPERLIIKNEEIWIKSQAKNPNETGSDLSLGSPLTRLSKRLGLKRRFGATADNCLADSRLTILILDC